MIRTRGNLLFSTEGVTQEYAQIGEDGHCILKQKMTVTDTVRNIVNLSRW